MALASNCYLLIDLLRLFLLLLPQGELPAAPAGPGRDDCIQFRKARSRKRQLQKNALHQKPSEGDQQPAGVLPPGRDGEPHHVPVITEGTLNCGLRKKQTKQSGISSHFTFDWHLHRQRSR